MTKRFIAFTAFAALLLASCGQEMKLDFQPVNPKDSSFDNEKTVNLHASVAQTKVLADNAGAFKWQSGDKITVVTSADVIREFTTSDSGLEADFSGSIPDADNVGSYALYPASTEHVAVGDMLAFNLDGEVVWNPNTSNMPMLGKISGSGASFKAVGGVLKLVLYNIPAEADYLQFVANTKKITGAFDIDDASAANVVIETKTADNAAEKELLINFSSDYSDRKVFYLPLPTGTIDGFTINLLDSGLNEIFSQPTKAGVNLVVAANHLILGPALNCAKDVVLWEETFELYNAGDVPSGKEGTGFGGVDVTYSVTNGGGTTQIYEQNNAGGTSPEILVGKNNGTFKASGIPTNGATTMSISFKENYSRITVSSTTEGVTITDDAFSAKKYTATVNNPGGASTIDLVFTNTASGDNVRVDDISLVIPGTAFAVPTIVTGGDAVTVAVGNLTSSVSYSLSDPVDDLGVSYILSGANTSWVSSVAVSADRVTVTATSNSNPNPEDNSATLTLKASGAKDKVLALTQKSALVLKPATINVLPGNSTVTASWTKDSHATSYLAYLCTSSGLADPTSTGIALTPELEGSTYTATQSGLVNGQTYYVYVKVNEVASNYVAEDAWTVSEEVVPESKTYYEKVTSAPADWSGTYLIIDEIDGKVATGVWNGGNGIKAASVSIAASKILRTDTVDDYAVTIAKVGDTSNYTLYFASTSLYAGYTGSSNTCASFSSSTDNKTKWTITLSSGNAVITNVNEATRVLRCNSASVIDENGPFRCYTTSTGHAIALYRLEESRERPGLAWNKASDTATILTGDDTMPTAALTNPHSLVVEYTSSDTGVATINASTGAITLVGCGETVISARFAGDATYAPANVSYTLTVTDSRMTCSAPTFSPAEGEVAENTSVTISSTTTGSTIYYTTDGTEPTTASSHGTAGAASASVTIDVAKTVKAIAVKEDWKTSAVESATYTIAGASLSPGTVLYSCDFGTSALATFSSYTGGTSYNSASTITYSCKSNNTKIMCETGGSVVTNMTQANLMVGGKNGGSGEWAKIAGIKTYGATQVTVRWSSNNNVVKVSVEESSTAAFTSASSTSNSGIFSLDGDEGTITLVFTAGSSSNGRIDDVVVEFTTGSGSGGGGGEVPPTPSGLPKYLGCYEMPAIESMLNGVSTSGTNASRGDTWYRYNTNNAKRQIATHTFAHPVSSDEVRTYTVLYDESNYAPLWCAHAMHTSMWPKNDIDRGSWTSDPAINLDQQDGLASPYSSTISRGHFVAAQYRKCSEDSMDQTFYYTNQAPQNQSFNGGLWAQLETQIVNAAPSGTDTLYVVTGVLYDDDWYAEDPGNRPKTYPSGNGKTVPYPSHFYVCLMKCSFNALGAMTNAVGCAYLCTNEPKPSNKVADLPGYQYTIDYVESLAGFDFFANVPTALQTTAESTKTSLW